MINKVRLSVVIFLVIFGFARFSNLSYGNEPIKPIPLTVELDFEKVALGKRLFSDTRLSKDNTVSCETCHNLNTGGVDGVQFSTGIAGRRGDINAPTVFNSGYNFRQFWDGRAETLEDQIDGPITNPVEMGTSWPEVLAKLSEDGDYKKTFKAIYGSEPNMENVKDAIATFERSLITPNSSFDKYLRGDTDALTEQEVRGYQLFKSYGCTSCHQGVNVGGNLFQVFGVLNNYFERRGGVTKADLGRFNITGNELDKHMFKVPSLRMAAVTPPYFHDGSVQTLREAVDVMFEFQLGRPAPDKDKDDIVAFLNTLVGEYQEQNE